MVKNFIILLLLVTCVSAKEPVKIIQHVDNNHFITAIGDTISLAFVDCPEINSLDIDMQQQADACQAYLRSSLQSFKTFAERDSLLPGKQIHLYRKIPLGYESINYLLLQKGYAYLVDAELAPLLYKQAAAEAKNSFRGMYAREDTNSVHHFQNATWLHIGIGFGDIKRESYKDNIIIFNSGIVQRRANFLYNVGCDIYADKGEEHFLALKLGGGYSFHRANAEAAFLIGPSLNRRYYYAEYHQDDRFISEYKKSDFLPGVQLQIQVLTYINHSFGGGLSFSANAFKHYQMYAVSWNFFIGDWKNPVK